jgi:signal transduction histidine kinase/CheY-like chemotaxis protein
MNAGPPGAGASALQGDPLASIDPRHPWRKRERRLSGIVFVVAVVSLALLCSAIIGLLSSTRAYVNGESLYSKAQKNASRYLERYVRGGDEADYQRFLEHLSVPLGDRQARLELDKPAPDYALARDGFLLGGNDAADVTGLIAFYRLFRHVPVMAAPIATWAAADQDIQRLRALAERVHARAGAPTDPERGDLLAEISRLDDALDASELRFSRELGVAARWGQNLLLLATAVLAVALIVTGLLFARLQWRRLGRSQQAAAEGNAKWMLAAEAGQFGLLEWHASGDSVRMDSRALAILELNPGLPQEFSGALLRHLVHHEDRAALRSASLRAVAERQPLVQRFRIELPGGRIRHLEVDARAFFSPAGVLTHAVGLLRDVTREVTAQNAMLEEDAAQRAYQAKREFLSRVSHELRTPLNAVIGFSDLMRVDRADPLSASQKARLDRVVDGGQYLLRLVNDLLDVARLEVGEMSIALADVRLAGVLRSAIELLDAARLARGVTVSLQEPPAGLSVVADAVRLKQVLVNVLSNAIKYNRPGGVVHVSCVQTAQQACIAIRDEGEGMTPVQQRDLFIPFRRLGDEQAATEGAGLGLVISRHLMERQGGSLDIDSTPGVGTTVTIRVNRPPHDDDEANGPTTVAAPLSGLPGAAGVVIYVEDDPVNVILMDQYMALVPDVQLMVARDGRAGLELARTYLPNLILLDMQLPDMSGLEVLDRLRSDPLTSGLRVIALSADAMPAQVTEAIARGAEAYWTKPLSLAKFKAELPKYLR